MSPNMYTNMVKDIYKNCSNHDAKQICNVMIGKFERTEPSSERYIVDKIVNKASLDTVSGYKRNVKGTDYYVVESNQPSYNLYNQKPISIQIKDTSRRMLYTKIKEIGIVESDIVKLKTDSISYRSTNYDTPKLDPTDINGWKSEQYTAVPPSTMLPNRHPPTFEMNISRKLNQKCHLTNCYAGAGKSHNIIHELIPSITGSYIVLTPSHATVEEYRKRNLECAVIQKYSFNGDIPNYDNIIIDELGLCDTNANDLIFKCAIANKNIYSFGDFNQLRPVGSSRPFNNPEYLKMLYTGCKQMNTNYRNDFTREYYDKIINSRLDGLKEVRRHMTKDAMDADVIICYRNETRKTYNAMCLTHRGFNTKFEVGVSLICKSNKFMDIGVYNNRVGEITAINTGETIEQNTYVVCGETFTHEQITTEFEPSYCRTIYSIQGMSIKSYHYPMKDSLFLLDAPELAYTIVSRLCTTR
jgi:hypothetical protein